MALGPSTRAIVRVLNQNSCGSGSICGMQSGGKALILTNHHVAGQVGRTVTLDVASTGDRIKARVIMSAYSNQTSTDWAILETLEPYAKVEPVKLTKKRPDNGLYYRRGYPRCQAFAGHDEVRIVERTQSVTFFEPDAIGGESGSSVYSHADDLSKILLTWQWGGHGAGQPTAQIYQQARNQTVSAEPRRAGMIEVDHEFDWTGIDKPDGLDDPVTVEGFQQEADITTLPIWAEDTPVPPPPGNDDRFGASQMIEYLRGIAEYSEQWIKHLEEADDGVCDDDSDSGNTFGL